MATRRYPSIPPLRLGSDLTSSGSLLITRTAVDWEGEALASSLFNSDYIPATLTNDARTAIEFILIDVSTIANLTTTGATIYKRGLPFTATGVDATDITEDTDKKLPWTQGETAVLIGTNQPWMYGQLANRKNNETIEGLWTFTTAQRPKLSSDEDASSDTELITRGQLNRTALGTTSSDRLTVAGVAGETLVAGNLVYFKASDSRWWKADADSAATSDDVVLGIAQGAGVAGGAITTGVLLRGLDQNQSGLTPGSTYYVSGTAGALSATPGSNNVSVGVAASATSILLVPRFDSFITPAIKALVEAITADAAEINKLDGYTGTTANLNEMAAIVAATDITGAELETLSAGVNSNADTLHTHTVLPPFFPATDWMNGATIPTNPTFQVTSDPTGDYLYSAFLSGSSPNKLVDIKRYDRDAITGNYYYNGVFASLTETGSDIGSGTTWAGVCAGTTYVYVAVENSANSNIAIYRFAKDLSGETTMTISGTASTNNGKLAGNDTVLYVSEESTSTNVKPYTISGTTATRGTDFAIATQSQYRRGWWFDGTDLLFADANDLLKVKRYNVSGTLQATSLAQIYTETSFFEAGTPVGIGFFKTGAIYLIASRKQTDGTTIETFTIEGVGITKP